MNIDSPIPNGGAPVGPAEEGKPDIRHLSTAQLAKLGLSQVAYVKPIVINGAEAYGIHAADGTPMAVAESHDVAIAAILQHEMIAAAIH